MCGRRDEDQQQNCRNGFHPHDKPHLPASFSNCSFKRLHTCSTWFSVVRMFPIESRRVSLSFSLVCDSKAFPVAFTPCMIASFSASSRLARTFPVSPSRRGHARKQTSAKGVGAINSQFADLSI